MIGEAKCTSQKGEKKKPKNQRTMRELTRIDRDWSKRERERVYTCIFFMAQEFPLGTFFILRGSA